MNNYYEKRMNCIFINMDVRKHRFNNGSIIQMLKKKHTIDDIFSTFSRMSAVLSAYVMLRDS